MRRLPSGIVSDDISFCICDLLRDCQMIRLPDFVKVVFVVAAVATCLPLAHAQQYSEKMFREMRWRMVGPFRGGRTRAAPGVPNQPNGFYIGAVNGGRFKCFD